jgi:hypothetical protein
MSGQPGRTAPSCSLSRVVPTSEMIDPGDLMLGELVVADPARVGRIQLELVDRDLLHDDVGDHATASANRTCFVFERE